MSTWCWLQTWIYGLLRYASQLVPQCVEVFCSAQNLHGSLNGTHFGGIKVDANVGKEMRDLPYNSALFGLVMTPVPSNLERLFTQGWFHGKSVGLRSECSTDWNFMVPGSSKFVWPTTTLDTSYIRVCPFTASHTGHTIFAPETKGYICNHIWLYIYILIFTYIHI